MANSCFADGTLGCEASAAHQMQLNKDESGWRRHPAAAPAAAPYPLPRRRRQTLQGPALSFFEPRRSCQCAAASIHIQLLPKRQAQPQSSLNCSEERLMRLHTQAGCLAESRKRL